MGPDLPDSVDKTQSSKSSSTTKESMTGKVGTALYVAPELGNHPGVRVKYSQKVDLYSLGIIFFEMCYKPLTTSMERVKVLGNLRTVCCSITAAIFVSPNIISKETWASKDESFIVWDRNMTPSVIKMLKCKRSFSLWLNHFCIVIKNFMLTLKTSLSLWMKP